MKKENLTDEKTELDRKIDKRNAEIVKVLWTIFLSMVTAVITVILATG